MTGPAPQMILPTFAGDKKSEVCTSPSPLVPFTLGERSGSLNGQHLDSATIREYHIRVW
jgi:hypothetical protein